MDLPRIRLSPDLLPETVDSTLSGAANKALSHARWDAREQRYHLASGVLDDQLKSFVSRLALERSRLAPGASIWAGENQEIGVDIVVWAVQ